MNQLLLGGSASDNALSGPAKLMVSEGVGDWTKPPISKGICDGRQLLDT